MVILVGDTHVRKEEPFFSAVDEIFSDLLEIAKEGDTIIQLGDFFHTYKPFPKEYSLATEWIRTFSLRGINVKIIAGNNAHEYHHQQKTYAIEPLARFEGVEVVLEPEVFTIEGKKYLMLPWLPQEYIKEKGFDTLEDFVLNYIENLKEDNIDFVLYHFEDETVFMGGVNTGINLSGLEKKYPNIKRVGGHIHLRSKNYIGTPYQTRADEVDQTGVCLLIEGDEIKTKEFEQYISYMNIDYLNEVPKRNFRGHNIILNIKKAPSMDDAYSKFLADYIYINNVDLLFKNESNIEEGKELDSDVSIKELLQEFFELNKVDKKVSNYLNGLF